MWIMVAPFEVCYLLGHVVEKALVMLFLMLTRVKRSFLKKL
jgi:hypothetical protein